MGYLVGQTPGDVGSHDWSYHGSATDSGSVLVTPRAAGEYYVVMLCCDGYTEVSERVVITITENPDPPVVVFTATVAVGDGPFAAGTALTVDFTGATDAVDWIGLYLVGQTPGDVGSHAWSYHGSATDSGSVSVTPREAGEYYVVLLCCDGYTEVSERVVITIGEGEVVGFTATVAVADYLFPLTEDACATIAIANGVELGGVGYDFAGTYGTKGCYWYSSGTYGGKAYFGTGGSDADMQTLGSLNTAPKMRFVGGGPFFTLEALTVDFTGATDAVDWIGLYLVGQTPGDVGSHDWSY